MSNTPVPVLLNAEPHHFEPGFAKPYEEITVDDILAATLNSFLAYLRQTGRRMELPKDLNGLISLRYITQGEDALVVSSPPPTPAGSPITALTPYTVAATEWYRTTGHHLSSVPMSRGTLLASMAPSPDATRVRWYILLAAAMEPRLNIPIWLPFGQMTEVVVNRKGYLKKVKKHLETRNGGDPVPPSVASKNLDLLNTSKMSETPVSLGIHPVATYGPHPCLFVEAFARAYNLLWHPKLVNVEEADPRSGGFNGITWVRDLHLICGSPHPDELSFARAVVPHLQLLAPSIRLRLDVNVYDDCGRRVTQLDAVGSCATAHDMRCVPLVIEIKKKDGAGRNPIVQAGLSIQPMFASNPEFAHILQLSSCPIVVMSVTGLHISVWFMYYGDKIYGAQFFSVHLTNNAFVCSVPSSHALAIQFQLVRDTLKKLSDFYAKIHAGTKLPTIPCLFPQPLSLAQQLTSPDCEAVDQLSSLGLVLTEYLPHPRNPLRCLYRGLSFNTGIPLPVYIKFVTGPYGKKAHCVLARQCPPLAPQLLWCGEIIHGQTMVVMEALGSSPGHHPRKYNKDDITIVESDIRRALNILHTKGLVHGDVRPPNIVIADGRAYLIDFDWSGKVGEAKYPTELNEKLWWQAPVELLRQSCIQIEDDNKRLNRTVGELSGLFDDEENAPSSKRARQGDGGEGDGDEDQADGDDGEDGRPLKRSRGDSASQMDISDPFTAVAVSDHLVGFAFEAGFEELEV